MDVDVAGFPQDPHKSGLVDFAGNYFRGNDETRQERSEVPGGAGIEPFFVKDVLLDCLDFAHGFPVC
jgi:hypothetical protein